MINQLLMFITRALLWLRYRVTMTGAREIVAKGKKGILFLANHPGLIDPPIVASRLYPIFQVHPLAQEKAVNLPVVKQAVESLGYVPIPNSTEVGDDVRERIRAGIDNVIEALKKGDNVLLYPAGTLYRSRYEDCRGNSAVQQIVSAAPDVRIVLVRTRGVWGSGFSFAGGSSPAAGTVMKRGFWQLLANGIIFMPRRKVTIELEEPVHFPRQGSREEINTFLEQFYNHNAPPNRYVPYYWWQGYRTCELPDPEIVQAGGDVSEVPDSVREQVYAKLREVTGVRELTPEMNLSKELGLDSLSKAELLEWVRNEFGFMSADAVAIRTVGDVLSAACGETISSIRVDFAPVPQSWRHGRAEFSFPAGDAQSLQQAFLNRALQAGSSAILADQRSGVLTYRDVVRRILALRPFVQAIPEQRVGIMLPASVAGTVTYFTTLFAGKTPVMFNPTVGRRHFAHSAKLTEVKTVLTSSALMQKLEAAGANFSNTGVTFLHLEDIAKRILLPAKLNVLYQTLRARRVLGGATNGETAVILFTSGSEDLPKAVPLSHGNILANLRDVCDVLKVGPHDKMTGILPPFHSFGLLGNTILPLLSRFPVAYHPNPTEGSAIGDIIEQYQTSVVICTPTFLRGILRGSSAQSLSGLRIAITGAEKCPDAVFAMAREKCPQLNVAEGYGITECSPVVAVNPLDAPKPGTIGKPLPSVTHKIVHRETGEDLARGETGLLLVRGASIFHGYAGNHGSSPFVENDGHTWYSTGDLVREDADGYLVFAGRVKRFVKLGGEMISLPAIEAVLSDNFPAAADGAPSMAVDSTPNATHPEIVLFSTIPVDMQDVNTRIRDGGLSPLHNIRRIIQLDAIPLLGSGKTDYRSLKERLGSTEK